MLIVCADDLGFNRLITDACLESHDLGVISAASAMVFMEDSERSARLAISAHLETGLHLNFAVPFTSPEIPPEVGEAQKKVARYMGLGKWAQILYNPFLRKCLLLSLKEQQAEYVRLFCREPAFYNGHKHLHLCMNMILDGLLPEGAIVRRSFTHFRGEKGCLNRLYRRWVDSRVIRGCHSTDAFFSLDPVTNVLRMDRIFMLAEKSDVEVMVHPWWTHQRAFLRSRDYRIRLNTVMLGGFSDIRGRFGVSPESVNVK